MQGKLILKSEKIPGVAVYQAFVSRDHRGAFVKVLEQEVVPSSNKPFGEIYLITAEKGCVRAGHYHRRATEYFSVIQGKGKLTLSWRTCSEEFQLDADEPMTVVVPPLVFHRIEGASDRTMQLLAYSDQAYNINDTDTYPGENDER